MATPVQILCAVPAFNAGDTTRGIEIARAIRDVGQQRGKGAEITFIFPQTPQSFAPQIQQAGFPTHSLDFALTDPEIDTLMRADHTGTELIYNLDKARHLIQTCMDALASTRPDLVVFGYVPMVGIAAQVLHLPSISFLPAPLYRPWVTQHLLKDIPDELDNPLIARVPAQIRRKMAGYLSRFISSTEFFRQPTLAAAGRALGWESPTPDFIGMMDADLQLVNDLPDAYSGEDVGPRTRICGPLFNRPTHATVAPEIAQHFAPGAIPRVFVSMGSSGEKQYLLEAIKAVANVPCRALVVVPPHICALDEARACAGGAPDVLLTDAFVPAHRVNAMADFAITHGGQGTVQTAMMSGTPVVGVGMQLEQTMNLDRLVRQGAGIRIARGQWHAPVVERALRRVITTPAFHESAQLLNKAFAAIDGHQMAGDAIWDFITAKIC
jgi:UDP:flavonoid glycosyltransferase YjiC (YdhE family)